MNDSALPSGEGGQPSGRSRTTGVRWWPAAVILILAAVALAVVRFTTELQQQERYLRSIMVSLAAGFLLLVWSQFFGRLSKWPRWTILGAVGLGVFTLAGLCRVRGFTGDVLPIFEWRWKSSRVLPLPVTHPPVSTNRSFRLPRAAATESYPQFLGPTRNATVAGPKLDRAWKQNPPTEVWRRPAGAGWSGFAILAPYAVTQEQRGEMEAVVAYDLPSGRELWAHGDAARYQTALAGEGPRATPTLTADRVYALGATGLLNCLDLATGQRVWSKNILEDNQAEMRPWGMAGSPLVWNGWVIVSPGGGAGKSLVAYRADTGERVWGGGSDNAGYSSPLLARLGDVEQVLIFNAGAVAGHEARTGELLWNHPWPGHHPHVAMPVVLDEERVLISSGYGDGSELLRVRRSGPGAWSATPLWKSLRLKAKFTNLVHKDGYVYGLDDGILACLEAATGDQKWKEGRYGHGQVILVADLLLLTAENGDLVLIEPAPLELRELGRISVFRRKTWNCPALAGSLLLMRNDAEAAAYRLPLASK